MSRFSRAFDGALKSATPPLKQAEAATIAGFHPSLVSRVLGGKSTLTPEHVAKLITALSSKQDRDYCVREFLLDCCPEDYRSQVHIQLGVASQSRAKGSDRLTADLEELEQLATEKPDLRRLISLLLSIARKPDQGEGTLAEERSERAVIGGLLEGAMQRKLATPPPAKAAGGHQDA